MIEALRFGSRRTYGSGDLGRYGLGLKTASLSQARCVTVVSEIGRPQASAVAIAWTWILIAEFDDWLLAETPATTQSPRAKICSAPAQAPS